MKNTIVITGSDDSGKTRLVKALAKEEEIVFITETDLKSPFAFAACTPTTKFIVIDDVSSLETNEMKEIGSLEKLNVNRKGKTVFTIDRPTLILITGIGHELLYEASKRELKNRAEQVEYLRGVIREKDELIELYREVKFLKKHEKSLF